MQILNEMQQDDTGDQELVLAATQVENTSVTSTTKTAVVKKSSPKLPLSNTFNNCSFGPIGTLNIHIHKN